MSLELWKQLGVKDQCRCCHSHAQTLYKSLYKPYIWLQKERIVLADLLMECFNIELDSVPEPLSHILCTICNSCIKRLQEAVIFKRQVQKCEERFKELYTNYLDKVASFKVVIKDEIIEDEGHDNEEITEDTSNTAVEEENQSMEADAQSIEKANTESTIDKHKKVTDDDDDDGLTDPWDEIDFDAIDQESTTKAKKKYVRNKDKNKKSKIPSGMRYVRIDGQYHCCKCKKLFKSLETIKSHFRNIHIPSYTCPQCPQTFFYEPDFVKHKLKKHNIDDRFKCNACDKSYWMKFGLTCHLNFFHMLGPKHKCNLCEFETFSVSQLRKHKFLHKTEKNFYCRFCNKSFLRRSTLNFHERIHTGDKRKVCNECGQAFVQKASLNYHMAKYHPEVPF